MADFLTLDDIDDKHKSKLYVQDYNSKQKIEGVQIVNARNFIADEGDFSEVMRINEGGEIANIPGFKIAQINRTYLYPGSIKAWHIHFKQNEIWYVPPNDQLFVGLWDVRKTSPTNGTTMRINLGGGDSKLLYIPRGVAHGSANFSTLNVTLFYFVDQQFNISDPDERRFPWDTIGADFWTPERD